MTNGDWLRSQMTDEYIADDLCVFFDDCPNCPLENHSNCTDHEVRVAFLKAQHKKDEIFAEWEEITPTYTYGTDKKTYGFRCSNCKNNADKRFNFCPNCGATMGIKGKFK